MKKRIPGIWKNPVIFGIISILAIIFARSSECLIHEAGHAMMLWLSGLIPSPGIIHLLSEPVYLVNIYPTGIPYFRIQDSCTRFINAVENGAGGVSIGGLLLNAIVTAACFWLFLKSQGIRSRLLLTVVFWILACNLGELFSYIPLRVFASEGDIAVFLSACAVHPVILLVPASLLIAAAVIVFFSTIVPLYGIAIPVKSRVGRIILPLCPAIIMGLYLIQPLLDIYQAHGLILLTNPPEILSLIAICQVVFFIIVVIQGIWRNCRQEEHSRFISSKKKTGE